MPVGRLTPEFIAIDDTVGVTGIDVTQHILEIEVAGKTRIVDDSRFGDTKCLKVLMHGKGFIDPDAQVG
jgi:hypothetical protein